MRTLLAERAGRFFAVPLECQLYEPVLTVEVVVRRYCLRPDVAQEAILQACDVEFRRRNPKYDVPSAFFGREHAIARFGLDGPQPDVGVKMIDPVSADDFPSRSAMRQSIGFMCAQAARVGRYVGVGEQLAEYAVAIAQQVGGVRAEASATVAHDEEAKTAQRKSRRQS